MCLFFSCQAFIFQSMLSATRVVGMLTLMFEGIIVDCASAHSAHLSSINNVSVYRKFHIQVYVKYQLRHFSFSMHY